MSLRVWPSNGGRSSTVLNSEPYIPEAWKLFMVFCAKVGHGEIEKLKIQDGVPMIAETVTKKVKFT